MSLREQRDHLDAQDRDRPQPGTSWQPWRGWGAVTGPPLRMRQATEADQFIGGVWIDWVMEEADD